MNALILVVAGMVIFLATWLFFEIFGLYRCPVCQQWVQLGVNATDCEQADGSWILCHEDGHCHRHTMGWYGLGGKSLEEDESNV